METRYSPDRRRAGAALETFLGGMETPTGPIGHDPGLYPLETFLGGMETRHTFGCPPLMVGTLKPSLVEWKLEIPPLTSDEEWALKPSLVEWKLAELVRHQIAGADLETFLGGMETRGGGGGDDRRGTPLKPSLVEWKQGAVELPLKLYGHLETFLSGMETP